jgi:hypothetical protein
MKKASDLQIGSVGRSSHETKSNKTMNINERRIYRFTFNRSYDTGQGIQPTMLAWDIYATSPEQAANALAELLNSCIVEIEQTYHTQPPNVLDLPIAPEDTKKEVDPHKHLCEDKNCAMIGPHEHIVPKKNKK